MVAYVFDKLLAQGVRAGQIPARTQAARDWYRDEAERTTVTQAQVMKPEDKARFRGKHIIGEMYMFQYNPKWKKTLPYYDIFPCVFPIDDAPGGFLGINMHYLPLKMRALLMDALYGVTTNKKYDNKTKLRLSYDLLNGASKFRWFKPCIKHYLKSQMNSRLLNISASEWDIAIFLPLARFKKATQQQVWKESQQIIKGRK